MSETPNKQAYLCASADWHVVVEGADNHEDAAAMALQTQLDSDSERFSVGPVISVIPIIKNMADMHLIYAPTILADIGMHKHAADLVKHIEKNG
jgi:hypothetical protein